MGLEITSKSNRSYRDLDLDFEIHPNTKSLLPKTGDDAVVRAVRYLIMTNHYERLFHPEIGSNLTKMLFEPIDVFTGRNIKQAIIDAINNYEPRVELSELTVLPAVSENGYSVSMTFFILNQSTLRRLDFLLERAR